MKILKFGGSSVANASNINKVVDIILQVSRKREQLVIVVSALGGVTDQLITLALSASKRQVKHKGLLKNICKKHNKVIEELIKPTERKNVLNQVNKKYKELGDIIKNIFSTKKLSPGSLDAVMSFGEQLLAYIISEAIKSRGTVCKFIDSRTIIKTDEKFGSANVDIKNSYKLISKYFKNKPPLSIMGGFIASTKNGVTTTLGRGGSDYTASLVGAALNASSIEIWTDVDGMLTADPRIVTKARLVPSLSYAEASELAYFGAKVLHPSTILPAVAKNIPVRILNSQKPNKLGTLITKQINLRRNGLAALACKRDISIINVTSTRMFMAPGFMKILFEVFNRFSTTVDVVTTSEVTVSMTIDDTRHLSAIMNELKIFADVTYQAGMAIICVVGEGLKNNSTLLSTVVKTVGQERLSMLSLSAGKRNVTIVLPDKDVPKAMNRLHDKLFIK